MRSANPVIDRYERAVADVTASCDALDAFSFDTAATATSELLLLQEAVSATEGRLTPYLPPNVLGRYLDGQRRAIVGELLRRSRKNDPLLISTEGWTGDKWRRREKKGDNPDLVLVDRDKLPTHAQAWMPDQPTYILGPARVINPAFTLTFFYEPKSYYTRQGVCDWTASILPVMAEEAHIAQMRAKYGEYWTP